MISISPISSSTSASCSRSSARFALAKSNTVSGISSFTTTFMLKQCKMTLNNQHGFRYEPFMSFVVDRFPTNEIDHTLQFIFNANGNLKNSGRYPELCADLIHNSPRIRTRPVHFVDEGYPRDVIPPHLPIDCDSLTLYPSVSQYVWNGEPYNITCTPATAHKTKTAPSNTRKALSTSIVKSTWPETCCQ